MYFLTLCQHIDQKEEYVTKHYQLLNHQLRKSYQSLITKFIVMQTCHSELEIVFNRSLIV